MLNNAPTQTLENRRDLEAYLVAWRAWASSTVVGVNQKNSSEGGHYLFGDHLHLLQNFLGAIRRGKSLEGAVV